MQICELSAWLLQLVTCYPCNVWKLDPKFLYWVNSDNWKHEGSSVWGRSSQLIMEFWVWLVPSEPWATELVLMVFVPLFLLFCSISCLEKYCCILFPCMILRRRGSYFFGTVLRSRLDIWGRMSRVALSSLLKDERNRWEFTIVERTN